MAAPAPPPAAAGQGGATNSWWVVGVLVAAVAQAVSNLGMVLQARSHRDEERRPLHTRRHFTSQPLWWTGMVLVVVGAACDFAALTLAPATLVAALGCLNLVAQAVWSPLLLQEDVSRHYAPLALILVGVVLAVIFGPHAALNLSADALFERFRSVGFAVYAPAVVTAVVTLLALAAYVEARFQPPPRPLLSDYVDAVTTSPGLGPRPVAAAATAGAPSRTTTTTTIVVHHGWARFHRVVYAVVSGVIGAQVRVCPAAGVPQAGSAHCPVRQGRGVPIDLGLSFSPFHANSAAAPPSHCTPGPARHRCHPHIRRAARGPAAAPARHVCVPTRTSPLACVAGDIAGQVHRGAIGHHAERARARHVHAAGHLRAVGGCHSRGAGASEVPE